MESGGQTAPESSHIGAGVAHGCRDQIITTNLQRPSDGQHTPKGPTSLQVSVPASRAIDSVNANMNSPKSPTSLKPSSNSSQPSPRSPQSNVAASMESPKSPRERLDDFLAAEGPRVNGDVRNTEASRLRNKVAFPSKAQSYSQLRNVSSPLPETRPLGHSSPPSPRSTASPPMVGSSLRPEGRQGPRTSSIDSAISSVSVASPQSHKVSVEPASRPSVDVSSVINTAGSAEEAVRRLLQQKQQTDVQNDQLWTMVRKQRKLILGLNQDLERAVRDKERYHKHVKDYRDRVPPIPVSTAKATVSEHKASSRSPAPSDSSADLPIQRHKSKRSESSPHQEQALTQRPLHLDGPDQRDIFKPPPLGPGDPEDWINSKGKPSASNHAHKQTSSSDVGIFGTSNPVQHTPPHGIRDVNRPSHIITHDTLSQSSPTTSPSMSPTSSFTAKRSQPYSAKPFHGPALTLTQSSPTINDLERMTPPRKAPPAPLDLGQPKKESLVQPKNVPEDSSASEYEDDMEADELPRTGRGRKKTREDDDREREMLLQQKEEERSRSKKDKSSKSRSNSKKSKSRDNETLLKSQAIPMPPSIKALSPEPTPALSSSFLTQPASLASMLSPTGIQQSSGRGERFLAAKPMSPGLPLSPRPVDRPMNPPAPRLPREGAASSIASPPLSPNPTFVGLPLSPRAPRQPIPFPPNTPMSMAPSSPTPRATEARNESSQAMRDPASPARKSGSMSSTPNDSESTRSIDQVSQASPPRGIFKGFISETYPGLLIPPNALPSIKVTVISSRLKPSRHSLVLKGADDEPVFTLGVSARFDQRDLWQVEKPILSLGHLDQQLRQSTKFDVKLPDRSLFSGHAPAKVDARRVGLEDYFEAILDTQMDEKAAVALCKYLSTNVSEPGNGGDLTSQVHPASPTFPVSNGRIVKEGYLTKRGKNFGGWKSRFFVLDEPVLRYFETPGGTLLGKISLYRAQIGKQSPPKPSGSGDEGDGQYRHAFLIREPKRKDSSSFMDHVLCAESDVERDTWVAALMGYINSPESDTKSRPQLDRDDSGSSRAVPTQKNSLKQTAITRGSPDSEDFDSLQAVPYEDTKPAQAPHVRVTPDPRPDDSPSPTTPGSQPSDRALPLQPKAISGPQNGAKISDAGAWGNKPMAAPVAAQREHKKRSLFGFHNKDTSHLGSYHPNGSDLSLSQQQYQEQITNVKAAFGAPLAEAVEHCAPRGVGDVCLPAVVFRCLQYLEAKNAASEEGIFRMSGSNTLVKNLKNKFNAEGDFDLLASGQWYDVHAVASLLKQYLRELPSMILTRELHLQFLSVLDIRDGRQKPAAYNSLVHKLPKANFHLLRALCGYLIAVVSNSDVNKMDIRNIGIVFSPTLNIPTPVILMFLTEFDIIFGDLVEDVNALSSETDESEALTPDDIRSPRQQMFSSLPTPSYSQTSFGGIHQALPRPDLLLNSSHVEKDIGFAPLQPAYDNTPMSVPYSQTQEAGSVTVPGPEYAVARPRNLTSGGSAKQSRRESSMLLMSTAQRKSSLPMMRGGGEDVVHEEIDFA